jgi:hypothetical protein
MQRLLEFERDCFGVVRRLVDHHGEGEDGLYGALLDIHVSVWPVQEVRIRADPQKSYLPQWLSSPLGMTSAPSQTFQRGRPPIPPVRSSSSVHSSDDSEFSMPTQVWGTPHPQIDITCTLTGTMFTRAGDITFVCHRPKFVLLYMGSAVA